MCVTLGADPATATNLMEKMSTGHAALSSQRAELALPTPAGQGEPGQSSEGNESRTKKGRDKEKDKDKEKRNKDKDGADSGGETGKEKKEKTTKKVEKAFVPRLYSPVHSFWFRTLTKIFC